MPLFCFYANNGPDLYPLTATSAAFLSFDALNKPCDCFTRFYQYIPLSTTHVLLPMSLRPHTIVRVRMRTRFHTLARAGAICSLTSPDHARIYSTGASGRTCVEQASRPVPVVPPRGPRPCAGQVEPNRELLIKFTFTLSKTGLSSVNFERFNPGGKYCKYLFVEYKGGFLLLNTAH